MSQDNELPIQIVIDPTGAKSGADQVIRSIDDIPKRAKGGLEALQKSIREAANFNAFKDGGQVAKQAIDDILARGKYAAQERIRAERLAKDQFAAMEKEKVAAFKAAEQERAQIARISQARDIAIWKEGVAAFKAAEREKAAANKAAQSQAFAQSPQGIFQQAGIRSPTDVAKELQNLRQAKQLWEEAGASTEGYHGALQKINSQMNVLESGNARARGSFHKMTAALASLTFELTGALYGIMAIGGAIAGGAIFGVKFMKDIEDAKMGISGTVLSMSLLNGVAMTTKEAMGISNSVIDTLAQSSLKYNVSLADTAKLFQAIVGPGTAAGMTLEEVGKTATIGAVAVKSMGLNSMQVVQEVRDLVQGGIQSASSTLATALGLKDKDIKAAKESAEGLFVFLEKRMEGFAMMATERNNTLSGSWDMLWMKVQRLFADPTVFSALVEGIKSISNAIATIETDAEGNFKGLKFNESLISAVKSYSEAITGTIKVVSTIVEYTLKWYDAIVLVAGLFVANKLFGAVLPLLGRYVVGLGEAATATIALGTASEVMAAKSVASAETVIATSGGLAKGTLAARGGLYGMLLWGVYELADFAVHSKWVEDNIFATMMKIGEWWDEIKKKMGMGSQQDVIKDRITKLQAFKPTDFKDDMFGTGADKWEANLAAIESYKKMLDVIPAAEKKADDSAEVRAKVALTAKIQQGNKAEADMMMDFEKHNPEAKRVKAIEDASRRYNIVLTGITATQDVLANKSLTAAERLKQESDLRDRATKAAKMYNFEIEQANKVKPDRGAGKAAADAYAKFSALENELVNAGTISFTDAYNARIAMLDKYIKKGLNVKAFLAEESKLTLEFYKVEASRIDASVADGVRSYAEGYNAKVALIESFKNKSLSAATAEVEINKLRVQLAKDSTAAMKDIDAAMAKYANTLSDGAKYEKEFKDATKDKAGTMQKELDVLKALSDPTEEQRKKMDALTGSLKAYGVAVVTVTGVLKPMLDALQRADELKAMSDDTITKIQAQPLDLTIGGPQERTPIRQSGIDLAVYETLNMLLQDQIIHLGTIAELNDKIAKSTGDERAGYEKSKKIIEDTTNSIKNQAKAINLNKAYGDQFFNIFDKAGILFGKMAKPIADVAKGVGNLIGASKTYNSSLEAAAKISDDVHNPDRIKMEQAAYKKLSDESIDAYANIAGAAKGMFAENSAGYKLMETAEKAFRAVQLFGQITGMAMDSKATALSIENAIATIAPNLAAGASKMFGQSGWGGFVGVAAMMAVMAAFGSFGGSSSSGAPSIPDNATSDFNQNNQGTGTVLGDSTAKSETIAHGIDILAKHSFEMLDYDNKMLTALQSIDRGMEGLASALVRVGGITGTGAISAFGTVEKSSSSPGFFGIGASTSSTNITDTGITIRGTVDALSKATGIIQQYETVVETWTDSGFFGIGADSGTNISTSTKTLVGEVPRQIALIFGSMSDSIKEGIDLLGLAANDTEMQAIMASIAAVPIDLKVSLKGLSGEDIKNALNGVFSKAFDNMVSAIAPWAEEFQKVGEGIGETFIRLAADARLVNLSLKSVGTGSFDDAFKANTTGQSFATYQQSANVQSARSDVTAAQQVLALAQALPSVIVGLDDFGVATLRAGANVEAITAAQLELDAANARLNSTLADMGSVTDTYAQSLVRAREYLLEGAGGADAFAEKWQFFSDNFISDAVKLVAVQDSVNAAFANMSAGTNGGLPGLGKQLSDLGYAIPKTNDEFAALVLKATNAAAGVGDFAESNADLTNTLLNLAPAFNQVQQAAQEAANSLRDYLEENFYTEAERKTRKTALGLLELTAVLEPLGLNTNMSHAEFLLLLPTLGLSAEAANNLAHSFVDVNGSAQGAADALANVVDSLNSFGTISVSYGSIYESAAAQVEKISQTVSASMSGASFSTSTSAQITALTELVRKSQYDLSKTPGGPGFSANRNYYGEIIRQANQEIGGLVKDLTNYTILEAQYSGKGKQLLDLQKWNEEQTKLYRDNGISMVALEQEYQRQRLEIINGGNAAAVSETSKFADTLSAWLRSLDQNAALSPLTAQQQQIEAETQYVLDIARANAGDATALANITKDAELYLSTTKAVSGFGADYSAVYSKVRTEVGSLANTTAGRPVTAEDITALRLEIADEKAVIARLLEKGNAEAKAAAAELVAAVAVNTAKTVSATVNASVLTETA